MNNIIAPALIKALHKKYDAEVEVAFAECVVYLSNAAGIGEHPEIVVEVDKKIQTILDGLMALANRHNIELIVDDPFAGEPGREGSVAIVHNIGINQFGMIGTDIEGFEDPVVFFSSVFKKEFFFSF